MITSFYRAVSFLVKGVSDNIYSTEKSEADMSRKRKVWVGTSFSIVAPRRAF